MQYSVHAIFPSSTGRARFFVQRLRDSSMANSLFDRSGNRKYLIARERRAFIRIAARQEAEIASFCLTLAITGARLSEVLALTVERIDGSNKAIVIKTLKQRKKIIYRAVPIPDQLVHRIAGIGRSPGARLWPWGRTTAWKIVKRVMQQAGIVDGLCMPKALRHAFAVEAGQHGVPLNIVQRWLGHARLETTAIYAGALGDEERNLAKLNWRNYIGLFWVERLARICG